MKWYRLGIEIFFSHLSLPGAQQAQAWFWIYYTFSPIFRQGSCRGPGRAVFYTWVRNGKVVNSIFCFSNLHSLANSKFHLCFQLYCLDYYIVFLPSYLRRRQGRMMPLFYQPVYLESAKYKFTFSLSLAVQNLLWLFSCWPPGEQLWKHYVLVEAFILTMSGITHYHLQLQWLKLTKHTDSILSQEKEYSLLGLPAFSKYSLKPFPVCFPKYP